MNYKFIDSKKYVIVIVLIFSFILTYCAINYYKKLTCTGNSIQESIAYCKNSEIIDVYKGKYLKKTNIFVDKGTLVTISYDSGSINCNGAIFCSQQNLTSEIKHYENSALTLIGFALKIGGTATVNTIKDVYAVALSNIFTNAESTKLAFSAPKSGFLYLGFLDTYSDNSHIAVRIKLIHCLPKSDLKSRVSSKLIESKCVRTFISD